MATSAARAPANTYGVLKLTLHATTYDWTFLPIAGTTYTDSGTGSVHAAPPPADTVPGAPTAVSAVAGDASAQVSWTAPASDGGSAITDYEITPYIGATAQSSVLVGSAATSRNVTGLTNGTAYTFTVAAINAIGTGPASAASNAVTPTAANTAPAAPTLNTPTDGATGIGTSPTLSVGVSDPDSQPDDRDLLRATVRQRQLRPDRPEHGCRVRHEHDHAVGQPRRRPEVRVVRDRQRRHADHDRPDLDLQHRRGRRSGVRRRRRHRRSCA